MRVLGIGMVKNEIDVIEVFVRHNLQFLDAIVLIDNGSFDGTREVLDNLMREGLPLVVVDDKRLDYNQGVKMTNLLKTAGPLYNADFVLIIDADEFISAGSVESFRSAIDRLSRWRVAMIPWRTYLPSSNVAFGDNILQLITERRVEEQPQFHKVMVPRKVFEKKKVAVVQGNHFVKIGRHWAWKQSCPGVALAHFPVRSRVQLINKVYFGWQAYLATPNRNEEWGQHWRRLYEEFEKTGFLPEAVELVRVSREYACEGDGSTICDPVSSPSKIALKYHSEMERKDFAGMKAAFAASAAWHEESITVPCPTADAADIPYKGNEAGPWSPEEHRQMFFADIPPLEYLNTMLRPRSVVDFGCGLGAYLKTFKNLGVDIACGVEGQDMSDFMADGIDFVRHDLSEPLDLGKRYDVVQCTEVIEHLHERGASVLMDTICRHAEKAVLFSAAKPGQPGIGHVNCRPLAHWLAEFAKRGWVPDVFLSLGFRMHATLSWFRANPVVFVPAGTVASVQGFTVKDLLLQEKRRWDWHGQKHGWYRRTCLGSEVMETYD